MSRQDQKDSNWDWTFHYVLSKKVFCADLNNSSNIRFVKDTDNYLQAFYITVNNSNSTDAEIISKKTANNLKKILTIKSQMTIDATLSDYQGTPKTGGFKRIGKSLTSSFSIEGGLQKLDLTDCTIKKLINQDGNLNLEYLSDAVSHLCQGRLVECIILAFKIIEGKGSLSNYSKYSCIRNVLSHPGPKYYDKTVQDFVKISGTFDLKKYNPANRIIIIDFESAKTKRTLYELAREIIKQAENMLSL